jgi:hypothetical protein
MAGPSPDMTVGTGDALGTSIFSAPTISASYSGSSPHWARWCGSCAPFSTRGPACASSGSRSQRSPPHHAATACRSKARGGLPATPADNNASGFEREALRREPRHCPVSANAIDLVFPFGRSTRADAIERLARGSSVASPRSRPCAGACRPGIPVARSLDQAVVNAPTPQVPQKVWYTRSSGLGGSA